MARTSEDWGKVLAQIEAGDRTALLKLTRMITGFLIKLRAYDFRDEWDDVVQEVVVAVVRAWRAKQIRESKAIPAWVRTVTRRQFIAMINEIRPDSDTEAMERMAWSPDLEILGVELRQVVDKLPEKQRQVIEALYIEQLTQEEAARSTGIPVGSLKRFQRLALETLRKRIAPNGEIIGPIPSSQPTGGTG